MLEKKIKKYIESQLMEMGISFKFYDFNLSVIRDRVRYFIVPFATYFIGCMLFIAKINHWSIYVVTGIFFSHFIYRVITLANYYMNQFDERIIENDIELPIATYSRVSSHEQKTKGDLDRQSQRLSEYCAKKKYMIEHIIKDVGSGLSDSRSGFVKLSKLVTEKKISKIIIEHKDRLTRFQFGFIERMFNSYGVEIVCVEKNDINEEEELVNDIMMLMASFSGKLYGKRSAKRRKNKKDGGIN